MLDSPPTTALSDAAILSTQCDGVLLVLDSGRTRREVAKRAVEALRRVNARVVGVLLNRMPTRGPGYYYYYYYYSGHYYTSGDGRNGNGPSDGSTVSHRLWRRRRPAREQA